MLGQKSDEQIRTPMKWMVEANASFFKWHTLGNPLSDYSRAIMWLNNPLILIQYCHIIAP
jgi:hypothetical protein